MQRGSLKAFRPGKHLEGKSMRRRRKRERTREKKQIVGGGDGCNERGPASWLCLEVVICGQVQGPNWRRCGSWRTPSLVSSAQRFHSLFFLTLLSWHDNNESHCRASGPMPLIEPANPIFAGSHPSSELIARLQYLACLNSECEREEPSIQCIAGGLC